MSCWPKVDPLFSKKKAQHSGLGLPARCFPLPEVPWVRAEALDRETNTACSRAAGHWSVAGKEFMSG